MLIGSQKKTWAKFLFLASFMAYCMCTGKGEDYYHPPTQATHPDGGNYVGSLTCQECHQEIYRDHLLTAHQQTSAVATPENVLGSFSDRQNRVRLENIAFEITRKGKDIVQQTLDPSDKPVKAQSLDIVIGSGVRGQSYLTWTDDHLSQLQVSYNAPSDQWINSPGYPEQALDRPIFDACLKCHVTHATNRDFSGTGNQYDPDRVMLGIGCERCHGPAEEHVVFHRNNPDIQEAKFMLRVDTLPRQQRLDLCAQCHSGPRDLILRGNSFSYLPGKNLEDYSRNYRTGQPKTELDVHGNQYGLLTSSACFLESPQMDCSTCHSSHQKQRGDTQSFITQCKSCHASSDHGCTASPQALGSQNNNCIACHMPNKPSFNMTMQAAADGEEKPVFIRTHRIGIYPPEEWKP